MHGTLRDNPENLRARLRRSLLLVASLQIAFTGAQAYPQNSAPKIEELIINATRLPRTIENIAGTVSIISSRDIEQEMATDLDDLARFQPGISMDTANRGGNQGFTIRGMGGNRVLTVIDDIRSNDMYAAGPASYGKNSFEVDDLKSVEIIRGPASVLYGADAMGGAVILHSKDPRDYIDGRNYGQYFSLRSTAASADEQYKGGFTYAMQNDALGIVAQFTRRVFQEHDVNGSGQLNPQQGDSNALLLKTFWDVSSTQQLSFTVDEYRQQNNVDLLTDLGASVAQSTGLDDTDRSRFGIGYEYSGATLLFDEIDAHIQQQTTDASQHTEQLRRSFSFVDPMNPASFGGTQAHRVSHFEFNQSTLSGAVHLRKTLTGKHSTHSLAWGLNFNETKTERPRNRCDTETSTGRLSCNIASYPFAPTENFPNKTFPDSSTKRTGVYFQDEIALLYDRLTLIPGIRFDQYDMQPQIDPLLDSSGIIDGFGGFAVQRVQEHSTSMSLGAIYNLSDASSVFVQYAEGYRPPNFDESNQAFVNLGHGYATVPNPNLDAESSQGLELGLRVNLAHAFISATLFNNRYSDFIDSQMIGMESNISLFQDVNIGKARIRGAEIAGTWYISDQWKARGSIAYARGDNQVTDTPLDSVDPLTTVIGLSYDSANNNWGGELLVTAIDAKSRVSSDSQATADAYQVVDLVSHFDWRDSHTLRAGIFNIFDTKYARWSSIKGLNANDITNINNARQPGTNLRIGYSYEF